MEHPKIGLNRSLLKNIKLNPFDPTDKNTNILEDNPINQKEIEDILLNNSNKLSKYKTEGCTVIYNESNSRQKNYQITFSDLLNILAVDESAIENFIEKEKGSWVEEFEEHLDKDQNDVEFESRFESGNLRMAIKVAENEYDLVLKNDINSGKSYHWFNFRFKVLLNKIFEKENSKSSPNLVNLEKNVNNEEIIKNNSCNDIKDVNNKNDTNDENLIYKKKIKFNIINCQKNDMLFSKGLKVLKYSVEDKKWSRDTKDIFYYLNGLQIDDKKFSTLTFSIELEKIEGNLDNSNTNSNSNINSNSKSNPYFNYYNNKYSSNNTKTFFFSYCYPYTYSDLSQFLNKIQLHLQVEKYFRIETIGQTLSGNKLEMLLITDFESSFDEIAYRPAVILTARVHPGESNSSFVIQGVIEFLISQYSSVSRELRRKYVFKIVPMLNPDGVINGNFRTSLIGKDLNRHWNDPRENACPTIYATKEMMKKTLQSREVLLFCDFHGHSNKNNFFLYCCNSKKPKSSQFQESVMCKLFQSKSDYFDPTGCIYKISQGKLKTARAVVRNELNIDLSYCLETSIGSITLGENKNTFFTPETYMKIGNDFCLTLFDMSKKEIFNETLAKIQIEEALKQMEINHKTEGDLNLNEINITNTINKKKKLNDNFGKKKLKPLKINKENLISLNFIKTPTESRVIRDREKNERINKSIKPINHQLFSNKNLSDNLINLEKTPNVSLIASFSYKDNLNYKRKSQSTYNEKDVLPLVLTTEDGKINNSISNYNININNNSNRSLNKKKKKKI